MPLPEGIDLKRKRAREHLNRLRSEVQRRIRELDANGVVRHVDSKTDEHVWNLNAPPSALNRSAVLAGEFVHNLRSVLDHLIVAIDTKPDRKRPLPEFPIYQNAGPGDDGFYPAGIMKVWSVPTQAQIVIESLQPYHSGNEPLRRLQQLDNIDKHRNLLAVPYGIVKSEIISPAYLADDMRKAAAAGEPFQLVAFTKFSVRNGRRQHGDEIARILPDPSMKRMEEVEVRPEFQIAIEEPGVVSGDLLVEMTHLYEFVEKVVLPKFKPWFK